MKKPPIKKTKRSLGRHIYTPEEREEVKKQRLKYIMSVCKHMSSENEPFTLSSTHGNYTLKSKLYNTRTFQASNTITVQELAFVNKVRGYVKKLDLTQLFKKQYFESDIQYMECDPKIKGRTFVDVIEIDIDQAYWETAYQLGILSDKLYELGSSEEISKRARMIALGSLAKKTYHYKFHGKQIVTETIERSLLTENVWFTICKRVSDVMMEIKKTMGSDYLFFWVDGVYVKNNPEIIAKTQQIISNWGYHSKVRNIHKIEAQQTFCIVYEDEKEETKRRFNYVSKDTKRNTKQDENLLKLCAEMLKK